jgi:transposase-like protein
MPEAPRSPRLRAERSVTRKRNLPPFPFGRADVQTALLREGERWLRKRLLVLRALLDGHTHASAARIAGVGLSSVQRWKDRALRGGLEAVLTPDHGVKQRNTLLPQLRSNRSLRRAIAAALDGNRYRSIRDRLRAIDAILRGASIAAAARAHGIKRTNLGRMLKYLRQGGLPNLLAHTYIRLDHLQVSRREAARLTT